MTTPNHSEWPPERIAEVLEYCEQYKSLDINITAFLVRAYRDLPSAVREVQRMQRLFRQIMIGGNHLATHIIGSSSKLPNDFKGYEEARDEEGMAYADCWVAWRKIMDARDALDAAKEPA